MTFVSEYGSVEFRSSNTIVPVKAIPVRPERSAKRGVEGRNLARVRPSTSGSLREPFAQGERIVAYREPFAQGERIVAYREPFAQGERIVAYREPFAQGERIVAYFD